MGAGDGKMTRKEAAEALGVSIRTVDRYLKSGKLSSQDVDSHVLLSTVEVLALKRRKEGGGSSGYVDSEDSNLSTHVVVDNGRHSGGNLSTNDDGGNEDVPKIRGVKGGQSSVYQDMYLSLKSELHEKQERLEIANYRVGQLETQLRNSMPMLEFHRTKFENEQKNQQLEESLSEATTAIGKLSNKLKYERFSKRIFVMVLLFLLALQPLWLLFLN